MRRLRRFTALLANLLLLQLVLVGSGAGSECTEHRAGAAHEMNAMIGHLLDGASVPGTATSDGHAPCHLPWAPGGCATMVTCGAAMLTTTSVTTELAVSSAMIAGVAQMAPRGPVSPPEPPPPRA